jgi:hypothetical protein
LAADCDSSRYALPTATADLSRRVGKVVAYLPLCEMDGLQRREFQEALLDADRFEDLPGKWQNRCTEWSCIGVQRSAGPSVHRLCIGWHPRMSTDRAAE